MSQLEIPIYSSETIAYIESIQKRALFNTFGPAYEDKLAEIFPSTNMFLDHIETQLESEFKDGNDDLKYELEAQLKNKATDEIVNLTKYEFTQHKSILNAAELKFRRSVVDPKYLEQIPCSATLHSFETNAEIHPYPTEDKPTIFFHGELFSANLMFCKLIIQLIQDTKDETGKDHYTSFRIKDDPETLKIVTLNAIYFYNYYYSDISDTCPSYNLSSPFENNILAIFLDSIAFFIYAHETGHAILEHNLSGRGTSIETMQNEEYEADRFAMIHLRNYCGIAKENVLTLLGPIIFFRYHMLRERYVPGLDEVNTHPQTITRLIKYVEWLQSKCHPNDEEIIKNFLQLEERLFTIISTSFERIHTIAP